MRVPLLALGLLLSTYGRAAAQGQAAVKDPAQCAVADANRSPTSYSHVRPTDPQGRARTGCSPVAPAPEPPPPPPPPPPSGFSITGQVRDVTTGMGLAGWVVQASGPTSASATTDANGNYSINGLPTGTYAVCEVVQSGWTQVSPTFPAPCASGMGYDFDIGAGAGFVNFGNQPAL